MAKYEQESKLAQLFVELAATFKQLEGVADLKKQDALLQSTSHRQARARRGRVGTWYPTLLVYGTLPYWSCMHAALVGRWRRRRVSLGERCVGRPCQPDQYHTGMLPSQPAWLPLRRSPLVSSPKCCPCGSPPLREAAPAVCQTGRARAPVQVPPVLPHGHHPGGRHHHHPEGGRRGRAAQRLRAAAELPGARARV